MMAQTNKKMQNRTNPLLCDIETGICEIPAAKDSIKSGIVHSDQQPVKLIYFTDPICSSCWAIEPQLRKLKLEYGDILEIDYRMGGLLPDWTYNSGGIGKPSDVAHHWDEVSVYYDMPIDGDVWIGDPLNSSYPPSIAFKAAQMQDKNKAIVFLREIREMVFLQKKNITKMEHLETAAINAELNVEQFKIDFEGRAKDLFNDDLKLAKEMGVRGFPSMFFVDSTGRKEFVYGSKPYSVFENAVIKIDPTAVKKEYDKSLESLFTKFSTLTAKEFSELSGISREESEQVLDELTTKGILQKLSTKNGAIWSLVN